MKHTIAIFLAMAPSAALASGDDDVRKHVVDQGAHAFAAADTTEVVQYEDKAGNSRPACFKYGSEVKLTADGGRVVTSFVIDDVVAFEGNPGQLNQARIVDAVTFDGGGVGAIMVPSERETLRVEYFSVYQSPGARAGLCTGFIEGPGRKLVRQGCDATADCAVGTCDTNATAADRKDFGCAILIAEASDSAAQLYWRLMESKK